MFNGSTCDRKSQLSGILTEPLNPRESSKSTIVSEMPRDKEFIKSNFKFKKKMFYSKLKPGLGFNSSM